MEFQSAVCKKKSTDYTVGRKYTDRNNLADLQK